MIQFWQFAIFHAEDRQNSEARGGAPGGGSVKLPF